MSDSPRAFLVEKILSLANVKPQKSSTETGKDAYAVEGNEFLYFLDDQTVNLKLNAALKKRIGQTLKSEPRAKVDEKDSDWINLSFTSEFDCEFVFLYIRYAWMSWRGQ